MNTDCKLVGLYAERVHSRPAPRSRPISSGLVHRLLRVWETQFEHFAGCAKTALVFHSDLKALHCQFMMLGCVSRSIL